METKNKSKFWGWVGKAVALVAAVYGLIQVYNYAIENDGYDYKATGIRSFYRTAPHLLKGYFQNEKNKNVIKVLNEDKGSDIDILAKSFHFDEPHNFDSVAGDFKGEWLYCGDYYSSWTFTLKNVGKKPFEDLTLELPFSGYYSIYKAGQLSGKPFTKKIDLNVLGPSNEVTVICWSTDAFPIKSEQEKTRFTHKYGGISIEFPVEVSGVYAFNEKYNNAPLVFVLFLISLLFLIFYSLGKVHGKNKSEESKKAAALPSEESGPIPPTEKNE